MKYEIYIPGQQKNEAGRALDSMLKDENLGVSFADMIRLRLSGAVSDQCTDIYFAAHENGVCYSRLWHGWGKHENAIGNFGNFMTLEACRGKGVGKEMMKLWRQDITTRKDLPLGLFCTSRLISAVPLASVRQSRAQRLARCTCPWATAPRPSSSSEKCITSLLTF